MSQKAPTCTALEPRGQPAEVVRVRMGEDDHADGLAAACAELRREDARSDVDGAAHEAPAVDDHRLPVRQVDDGRVPLPDVEERHAELPVRDAGPPCPDLEQEQQRRRRPRRRPRANPKRERGERHDEDGELPGRGLRHVGRERRHREAARDRPDENESARRDGRASPLGCRPPPERRVREAERERHGLPHGDREQVGEDTPDGHARREPRDDGHAGDGCRERRCRGPGDRRETGGHPRLEPPGERPRVREQPRGRAGRERNDRS